MMASSYNKLEMAMASSCNGMERRRIIIGQKGSGRPERKWHPRVWSN